MAEEWKVTNEQQFDHFVNHIKATWNWDKPLKLEPKQWRNKMSMSQRGLLHVWIKDICLVLSQSSGEDFPEKFMKIELKRRFGLTGRRKSPIDGVERPYLISTEDYNDIQMSELLTKIHIYANDIQITLDVKNCKLYMQYREASM